ncbi:class I SAM-dependent methyltransferase [Halomicrobium sp. IBSBa]|uniref:class I SAM-dependent methyltransferase n=1 Tax=Halomicrobium sp. IBSBa TaxID=2778916 RepID=UPI001ABFB079|nr:class I SAM-dependent methyltransferase [Halomicrobium sp. IBSBa]MBO4247939.1 class I SAM-dependent methyltransferase [Halomicrobium sp. IBSBa]
MSVSDAFDEWARSGKDQGMEERHWHTAKHALARMPVESEARSASKRSSGERGDPRDEGDTVLDLGCGSGYAGRALRETKDVGRVYGVDVAPEMAHNARAYTDDPRVAFAVGDFEHLPFDDDSIDHCWSMEAFYYAQNPHTVLDELRRVLRPGGTFYCAVNRWEEHVHSHEWEELVGVPMLLWSEQQYREAFREAGFAVAGQDRIPDTETEIPAESEFPTEDWETRAAMVERYREYGTLLTVGVVPE